MAAVPLTIYVDADVAKAYEAASEQDRDRMQHLLGLRLQELVASSASGPQTTPDELGEAPEAIGPSEGLPAGEKRLAMLRQACGIWRDRDDLPTLEELRGEWERFDW